MLERDGKEQRFYIHEKVIEFFDNEFDYRETANCEELTNLAVALFIGMAGGLATATTGGGGGSSTNNNWGRNKDDNDLRWDRRCAKVQKNSGFKAISPAPPRGPDTADECTFYLQDSNHAIRSLSSTILHECG